MIYLHSNKKYNHDFKYQYILMTTKSVFPSQTVLIFRYSCSYTYLMNSMFMHDKHHKNSVQHLWSYPLLIHTVEPHQNAICGVQKIAKIQGHIIVRLIKKSCYEIVIGTKVKIVKHILSTDGHALTEKGSNDQKALTSQLFFVPYSSPLFFFPHVPLSLGLGGGLEPIINPIISKFML